MTAEKATAQEATRKVAFAKVLAIQIIAYVVLVALALVPGMMYGDAAKPAAVPFTIIASLAMVVLLVVFSPFRDGVAGHVIAAIAGLLSAICATTVMLGNVIFPAGLDGGKSFSMEEAWIAGVGGLLIVLIIVSFGRQMARENRTHLIRSLSHSVVEGVAMIASAGWCFLPVLLPTTHSRAAAMSAASGATVDMFSNVTTTWVVAAIVTVLVAVALTVCSYFWHRDADPEPDARSPWIGLALLPVMLTGLAVGLAALALVVLYTAVLMTKPVIAMITGFYYVGLAVNRGIRDARTAPSRR